MANSQFLWNPEIKPFFLGKDENHSLEAVGGIPNINTVMTGIGARVKDNNVTTLRIESAIINSDGTLGTKTFENFGDDPNHKLERFVTTNNPNDVVVGFAMRVSSSNVASLRIYTRQLDTDTGKLSDVLNSVTDGDDKFEIKWYPTINTQTAIMTRLGLRVKDNNLKTAFAEAGNLMMATSV